MQKLSGTKFGSKQYPVKRSEINKVPSAVRHHPVSHHYDSDSSSSSESTGDNLIHNEAHTPVDVPIQDIPPAPTPDIDQLDTIVTNDHGRGSLDNSTHSVDSYGSASNSLDAHSDHNSTLDMSQDTCSAKRPARKCSRPKWLQSGEWDTD